MIPVITRIGFVSALAALVLVATPVLSGATAILNPFLTDLNEPIPYREVTSGDVTEYAGIVIGWADAMAEAIRTTKEPTFETVVAPFDELLSELNKANNNSFMLYWVSPDAATRDAGLAAYQEVDSLTTYLYSDRAIFDQIVAVKKSEDLAGAAQKLVVDLIRDMRHNGVALPPEELGRLKAIKAEVNELTTQYSTNMNTDIPKLDLDAKAVAGLPENFRNTYATENGRYEIPVIPATAGPVLNNADVEETRRAFFMASNTRAAEPNLPILDQLREKRHELAGLMNHDSFADYMLEVNMARNPDKVWNFLNDLIERTGEKAEADLADLREVRHEMDGTALDEPVQPWNRNYLHNAILERRYSVDVEKIREYLPLNEALRGMMDLYQELLDQEYRKIENPSVWHEEVEAYEVHEDGKLVGRFYLDLFPRPNKESWFYGVGLTAGRRHGDGYEIPVSMLLGNFTRPTEELPSLVSHRELRTLFHEFGHIMHGVSYRGEFATLSGSKRDFGEAMAQIFENWIWDYDVLRSFARHYETGEVLPKETFDSMLAAKNVGSGLRAQGGLRNAVYDMTLYNRHDPRKPMDTDSIWDHIADRFVYAPHVEGSHPQASWIHINTHPVYYYGYLWSAVYAQDMFTQFEANGLRDTDTGTRYRTLILANGNQRPDEEAVEEFLGRPMNNAAYIRSLGLE